jgi:hypothetical protein
MRKIKSVTFMHKKENRIYDLAVSKIACLSNDDKNE